MFLGTNDYLEGNPVAVTKRRGPALPSPVKQVRSPVKVVRSPVKFDVCDNNADEETIETGSFTKAGSFYCTAHFFVERSQNTQLFQI